MHKIKVSALSKLHCNSDAMGSDSGGSFGGGGSGISSLLPALVNNATSAYESTAANPLNLALLSGGQATTEQGSTMSAVPSSIQSSGLIIGLLAVGAIVLVIALAK